MNWISSEVRPGCKVVSVDGFDKCSYGRTECIFVMKLGQLYFCASSNDNIVSVFKYW